ncbi:MAG TPA: hypothetical protein VGC05_04345, partial [Mycobacterium sp.]
MAVVDPLLEPELYRGRGTVRARVLAMSADAGRYRVPKASLRASGPFWCLHSTNGNNVLLRTHDFETNDAAEMDAALILGRTDELTVVGVHGADKWHSLWVVLEGEVVLVSGRAWHQGQARTGAAISRMLRQA